MPTANAPGVHDLPAAQKTTLALMSRSSHACRQLRGPRRPLRQRGATIVEFAIIAPVFVMLMIGVIELSMVYFANLTMQHAVREGARYAVTGQSNLDPNTANQQRYAAVLQKIKDSSMGMYDKVSPTVSVTNMSGGTSSGSGTFGSAGDIIVISLDCNWPMVTPMMAAFFSNGKAHFVVSATMRNESYGGI